MITKKHSFNSSIQLFDFVVIDIYMSHFFTIFSFQHFETNRLDFGNGVHFVLGLHKTSQWKCMLSCLHL